jgi:acetyl esterase/lipase
MQQYNVELGEGSPAILQAYVLDKTVKRGAVIIFPGGAYEFTSDREAEPVALKFAAAGFHAFVLRYSVAPLRHPLPLKDAEKALSIVRSRSEEWNLDPEKVAVCGFSAGGHLAATLGIHGASRPDALILAYPVITGGPFAHQDSFKNLLGSEVHGPEREFLSLENHVDVRMPPTFLWHTCDDTLVPVENSLLLANALRRAGVSLEFHVFCHGRHGISLAIPETDFEDGGGVDPHVARWMDLCTEWLADLFQ